MKQAQTYVLFLGFLFGIFMSLYDMFMALISNPCQILNLS
jgi:hypothetical protein